MLFSLNQTSTIPPNQFSGEEGQAPSLPTGILFGALATPLITLFAQPVFAFSITPPQPGATNVYFPRFEYTVDGDGWVSRLDPLSTLPTGGTSGFNSLLSPFEANGWTFSQGQTLNGSFNIDTYETFAATNAVGANLILEYLPQGNDPVNDAQTNLHWIQRVTNNNSTLFDPGFGIPQDVIDVPNLSLPYSDPSRLFYDLDSGFTPPGFQDGPLREEVDGANQWQAELYLASTNPSNPFDVTIYDGISWGWSNAPLVDVAAVVDVTASMGTDIILAQLYVNQVLNQLDGAGIDYRVAIADFKDHPQHTGEPSDYPYLPALGFTDDRSAITNTIDLLPSMVGGGGDQPESAYSALIRAIQAEGLGNWRNNAQKFALAISDAPPHDPEPVTGYTANDVVDEANSIATRVFSYVTSGNSAAVSSFASVTSPTGGRVCVSLATCDDVFFDVFTELITPSSLSGGGGINAILRTSDQIALANDQVSSRSVPESNPIVGILLACGFGWLIRSRKQEFAQQAAGLDGSNTKL